MWAHSLQVEEKCLRGFRDQHEEGILASYSDIFSNSINIRIGVDNSGAEDNFS